MMTPQTPAPPTPRTSAGPNSGPKPVTVDDLLMAMGQMQAQLLVLQRENAFLKERLAALGAPGDEGEA
jgi:hypothetical protein